MQSICPAASIASWLDDGRATTVCVARPLGAMVAWMRDEPLSRGVTHRWSVTPRYRRAPGADVAQIIDVLERGGPCRFVACALAADARIFSGLLWCRAAPSVTACSCERVLPTCPASDPTWGMWGDRGEPRRDREPFPPHKFGDPFGVDIVP